MAPKRSLGREGSATRVRSPGNLLDEISEPESETADFRGLSRPDAPSRQALRDGTRVGVCLVDMRRGVIDRGVRMKSKRGVCVLRQDPGLSAQVHEAYINQLVHGYVVDHI